MVERSVFPNPNKIENISCKFFELSKITEKTSPEFVRNVFVNMLNNLLLLCTALTHHTKKRYIASTILLLSSCNLHLLTLFLTITHIFSLCTHFFSSFFPLFITVRASVADVLFPFTAAPSHRARNISHDI